MREHSTEGIGGPQGSRSEAAAAVSAPRPLRVAWVAGPQTLEDYGRILQPVAIGLLDELVELTAVCPERADAGALPSPPMKLVRYGRLSWWAFWETAPKVQELAEGVRESGIDLLHALDAGAAPLTIRLSRLAGVRYLVSGYALPDARALGRLPGAAAGALAGSAQVLKRMRRRHVVSPDKLHLLRPGVYQVRHATCFTDPQRSVTLVAGGRMNDLRAFRAAIRSFADIIAKGYDCACFLLGGGPAEPELRAAAEKLSLGNALTFADRQPHALLSEIFKAADIYISPVAGRGLDVPCLLAMAAGVPVLATGQGASDFLREGQTALFFRRGDAADLTARLVGLLEDRASARALADRALEHLREHHRPAAMVAELARIYRQASARNGEG
ncbi:MAG TPA: glycosyltransferase family 4 protein [Phycisphaerae bacterium]|nr:glycosyltransferase family 4 protein [Phycisphaerae bacterium]